MVTESGAFVQTQVVRPCPDLNLRPHERGESISTSFPSLVIGIFRSQNNSQIYGFLLKFKKFSLFGISLIILQIKSRIR